MFNPYNSYYERLTLDMFIIYTESFLKKILSNKYLAIASNILKTEMEKDLERKAGDIEHPSR